MIEFAATLYAIERLAEWAFVLGLFGLIAIAWLLSLLDRKPR